jgi:hypothetical protein
LRELRRPEFHLRFCWVCHFDVRCLQQC